MAFRSYLRTKTRPEPMLPVPVVIVVVIVVVMDAAITPADSDLRPVETGARCMRAGALLSDMRSSLDGLLRCGQQIHLQLFAPCPASTITRPFAQ